MSEQRSVKATLQIFGCSRLLTLEYLLDMAGINSTKEFLALNKETLNTSHNNLSGDVDEAVNGASCV